MPMPKRFTAPIQVVLLSNEGERVRGIAAAEGVSIATVIRDLIGHGIAWRERATSAELGTLRSRDG